MAMGKKTGRGVFGEEQVNGYRWSNGKVSWRKERSGQREPRSDNGSDMVKKRTGNSYLLQKKRRKPGKGMKWVRMRLGYQPEKMCGGRRQFFSLKYADGLECNVSLTESNFRKLFFNEKTKKTLLFFSRNISCLFEASFILTNYLSNL